MDKKHDLSVLYIVIFLAMSGILVIKLYQFQKSSSLENNSLVVNSENPVSILEKDSSLATRIKAFVSNLFFKNDTHIKRVGNAPCNTPEHFPNTYSGKLLEEIHEKLGSEIQKAATEHNTDCRIIMAIMATESSGIINAVGKAGEIGLMQIMPSTARWLSVSPKKLFDPELNIKTGTRYLDELREKHGYHNLDERILAYNQGPSGARKLLIAGIRPKQHTYVKRVRFHLKTLEYTGV